jgi:hypothetical protein
MSAAQQQQQQQQAPHRSEICTDKKEDRSKAPPEKQFTKGRRKQFTTTTAANRGGDGHECFSARGRLRLYRQNHGDNNNGLFERREALINIDGDGGDEILVSYSRRNLKIQDHPAAIHEIPAGDTAAATAIRFVSHVYIAIAY